MSDTDTQVPLPDLNGADTPATMENIEAALAGKDFFWLDLGHSRQIRRFVIFRAGLAGAGAVRTLARALSFPFALVYLLLYATAIHARRALRKAIP